MHVYIVFAHPSEDSFNMLTFMIRTRHAARRLKSRRPSLSVQQAIHWNTSNKSALQKV